TARAPSTSSPAGGPPEPPQGSASRPPPPADDPGWRLPPPGSPIKGRGPPFPPPMPTDVGPWLLSLRDAQKRQRNFKVEVLADGKLLLGTAAGPFDPADPTTPPVVVRMRAVEPSRDLDTLHS